MGFFVVSAVFSLWVNFSIRVGGGGSTEHAFVPSYGVLVTMGLLTASLLMMAPYFGYVFDFVEPDNVVRRIKTSGVEQALRPAGGEGDGEVDERRVTALSSLEQLADVALNAIDQKDKGDRVEDGRLAVGARRRVPAAQGDARSALVPDPRPPRAGHRLREHERRGARQARRAARTWLEYKVLRQYQMVYGEALTAMRDIITLIAIDTRYIGADRHRRGRPARPSRSS